MLRSIAVIKKRDRFGLGYKPDKQGRKKFMEEKREERIASFLEKVVEDGKMEIPLLSYSFRSVGFINPELTQKGEKKMTMDVDMDVNEAFESLTIDIVDAPFCPDYLFRFNFCWTSGPFVSRFEFGP